MQLGIIGVAAFVLIANLAFVRSRPLAVRQRSVITWQAIVLAIMLTASRGKYHLVEFGQLAFIICCVKASQSFSWRTAFRKSLEPEPL
ncbi:MAG: hypothetical protein WED09_06135 [Homoserinimonas sp.]